MAHGVLLGTLSAQIPLLRDRLAVSPQSLGFALFFASAGGLVGMPLTGRLMQSVGSTAIIRVGGALAALSLLLVLNAPSLAFLCAGLFGFGFGFGTVDVAMNAQAVALERAGGRAILGGIHAMWSVGSFLGALGGAALLWVLAPAAEGVVATILSAGVMQYAATRLDGRVSAPLGRAGALPLGDARLWLIGVLMALSFGIEGGAADWSGLYLHLERGLPAAAAPLAYSVFALAMVAMRFAGDGVRARFGDQRILLGGFLVLGGLGFALVAPVWLGLAGFACAGAGIANVVPALFALAGHRGGGGGAVGLASTLGYAGTLLAPPFMGFVAGHTSIGAALALLGAFGAVIALASLVMTPHQNS